MAAEEYPPLEDVWMDRECILDRVWLHLNDLTVNPDTRLYFYCMLELRFCIESIFFELLLRLKEGQLTNSDLKSYRPVDYINKLRQVDADFLQQASEHIGFSLDHDDIRNLARLYGQIGRYLHLPKEPFIIDDQTKWKETIEDFVPDAFKYLSRLCGHEWPGA